MDRKKRVLLVAASVVLAIVSYFYLDRQLVDLFHAYNLRQYYVLHYLQQLPEPLLYVAPFGIMLYFIRRSRKQENKFAHFSLVAASTILTAVGLKLLLKFCFGRYWPDTFKESNLSYLHDRVYGFNPFSWGVQYQSFPSGHMMTIVAFAVILSEFYPRLKWASVAACLIVALSLLILYYHFLSDIVIGAVLGWIVALTIRAVLDRRIKT